MRVCFDTNLLIRIFSRDPVFTKIRNSLWRGRFVWLISNEILLEYQEIVLQRTRIPWVRFEQYIDALELLGYVLKIDPHFHFSAVLHDADDNKVADCAISGEADYIVTSDRHFQTLLNSGYKPLPISPAHFANLF